MDDPVIHVSAQEPSTSSKYPPLTPPLVIPDVMNDVLLPQGLYPENFIMISQFVVCQEEGVKKAGTWRTLKVPDWRLGGWGHI